MYRPYVAHHGVLGMKWGIRRGRTSLGTSKAARSLTNEQLSTAIRRIELEKRYTQLTTKEKSATDKWVKSVLQESSKQVATKYVSGFMTKQVEKALKKSVS